MRNLIKFIPITALLAIPVIAQQDVISTVIGGGPGNMPAIDANLNDPIAVAVDHSGNYYLSAYNQNRVFKVNPSGTITILAGLGIPGYAGDGVIGGAANALLNGPAGLSVDNAGNVYISDYNNFVIRKVDTHNTITTIAGVAGLCNFSGDGAPATGFHLCHATDVAADTLGNLYIADQGNCRVRKLVLSSDTISTYAGTGSCGFSGDGAASTLAQVNQPGGVAADTAGNVYISDTNNYRIREVTISNGFINTIAGNGTYGFSGDGGPANIAEITRSYYLAVNSAGTKVYIPDQNNQRIRQIIPGGIITTVAGSGTAGFCGDAAPAISACLYNPQGVALTSAGAIYIGDNNNNRVRQFTVGGNINTVAGNGSTTKPTLVSGIAPLGVVLNYPQGVYEDPTGNIFFNDTNNYMVRELAEPSNLVDFFAGTGTAGYSGDGGLATSANLNYNYSVAGDSSGNIYIADTNNCIVRQVNTSGVINTFAGIHGSCAYSGDGGAAASAQLYYPYGVFVDSANNVFIADTYNNVIRKVTGGIITTFAGNGTGGFLGDGDPATSAELNRPNAVAKDGAGNVYIADTNNCRIRQVSAASGIIYTVAGQGTCNFNGDGVATSHNLNYPSGLAVDQAGNMFIADTNNSLLRWVSTAGFMTTFAGNGTSGYIGDGVPATSAELYYPDGVSIDAAGNVLTADQNNFRIRGISAFAALNTSDTSIDFGLASVGSSSTPQNVILSALGPLTLSNIVVTGDFNESDNCPASLPNGSKCTMYVYFKPTGSGTRTGTVSIYDNGYFSGLTTIPLVGTGSAISVTGGPINFGSLAVKSTSAAKTVTVTNKGKNKITMGAITLTDATDFAIASNTCPASGATLAASASCTIGLTFTPQTTGVRKGAVVINDSDPSSPQVVGLSGTGTSTVVFNPLTVAFGTHAVGTTSLPIKATLTNNTGKSLTLGTPALSITGPYVISGGTSCTNGLIIVSGGSCFIKIEFIPTSTGYQTGAVTVTDSDATSPQTLPITGTATAVEFTPPTINFGTGNVGQQLSAPVTITNVGPSTITFTAASFIGTNNKDFYTNAGDPPCAGKILAGATCSFTMYFKASQVGAESATYEVFDNNAGSPQTLPLAGTGQ